MPTVTLDGVRTHWLEAGIGEPVLVLLHAFPLHAAMWEPQLAGLSDRCRVLAPDLLGFGGSDAPADASAYSVERWADGVAALLDHLGFAQVVLGGLSMGGYVAFAFLRRHRRRVTGLVLADTRAGPDTPEIAQRRTDQAARVAAEGPAALVDTLLEGLLGEHTRAERPAVVEATRRLMDNPATGVIGALEAMKRRPDSTPELASIDVPTLVAVGADDVLSPPDVARELAGAIPGATLAVLPDAGHLSSFEAPDAFNRAVISLMGRCQAPGGAH